APPASGRALPRVRRGASTGHARSQIVIRPGNMPDAATHAQQQAVSVLGPRPGARFEDERADPQGGDRWGGCTFSVVLQAGDRVREAGEIPRGSVRIADARFHYLAE